MEPYFQTGQYLLVNHRAYQFVDLQRGDIIVLHMPLNSESDLLKRIVGLPYETVEFRETELYIDGQKLSEPYLNEPCSALHCPDAFWQLAADEYLVLGDNRNFSRDSRTFGAIGREIIIGTVIVRYFPLSEFAWVHQIGIINEDR